MHTAAIISSVFLAACLAGWDGWGRVVCGVLGVIFLICSFF